MLNKQIGIHLKERKKQQMELLLLLLLFSVIVSYLFKCMQREMISFFFDGFGGNSFENCLPIL